MTIPQQYSKWSLEILKEVPLFKEIGLDELKKIFDMGKFLKIDPYTNIIVEGEMSWGLYLILEGIVVISKTDRFTGDSYDIANLKRGNFFGEMSLIDESPRSASARSISYSEVLYINKDNFLTFLEEQSSLKTKFYQNCTRQLIDRLRELGDNYVVTQYQLWRKALNKEIE
jgi:CRP-like cAMP-binding protein